MDTGGIGVVGHGVTGVVERDVEAVVVNDGLQFLVVLGTLGLVSGGNAQGEQFGHAGVVQDHFVGIGVHRQETAHIAVPVVHVDAVEHRLMGGGFVTGGGSGAGGIHFVNDDGDTHLAALLLDDLGHDAVSTRTWSLNHAQLHELAKRGYRQLALLKDDRGPGVDTVYFGIEVEIPER